MKVLLDEHIDVRLAAERTAIGHDVTAMARDYPARLHDREVLAIAVRAGRTLITKDRDFGDLIFREELRHAGILYLRMRGSLAAQRDRLHAVVAA